jgi:hypothetical protein
MKRILQWTRGLEIIPGTPEFNILLFSFLLNLAWELWQVPFFEGMANGAHWLGVKICTQATLGDAATTLVAFWAAAAQARTRYWIAKPRTSQMLIYVGVGVVVTILLEALATGILSRWKYSDSMPRVPVLGTGLLPLLQWCVVPLLVIWFVRRQTELPMPKSMHEREIEEG